MLKLNAVQVEVSTICQLKCMMCPRSIFLKDWINKNMDLDTYKKIPFKNFRYVHLQGWGEPLLNPNVVEMIEIAKRDKCKVGTTTNGILLKDLARDLVNAGIDLIVISVASVNDLKQKVIRGYDLNELFDSIRVLSNLKKNGKPKIVINTIMLKDTIHELPEFVRIAKELGVDEVIANNLDYIPKKELSDLKVYSNEVKNEYIHVVNRAKALARELNVNLAVRPLRIEEALVCAENPIRNCFITVNGDVAPCVYSHLPTKSNKIVRFFEGREVYVDKMYFGNVNCKDFKKIWNSKEYKNFRAIFEERIRVLSDFLNYRVPKLPEICRSCYKAYSV